MEEWKGTGMGTGMGRGKNRVGSRTMGGGGDGKVGTKL